VNTGDHSGEPDAHIFHGGQPVFVLIKFIKESVEFLITDSGNRLTADFLLIIIFARKTIAPNMLVTARAFFAFVTNITAPEKLHTTFAQAFFILDYVIRGNLEIKFPMHGMFANKNSPGFVQIFDYITHA
jgi:hypothetical protein